MPPRYVYWTILIDGKATAFRAREREELLPTFNQLARKNRDIAMRYFARGKLWDTPEQAEWAARNVTPPRESRTRDWRPGGSHKDPRARFKKSPAGTAGGGIRSRPSTPEAGAAHGPRDTRPRRQHGPAAKNALPERAPTNKSDQAGGDRTNPSDAPPERKRWSGGKRSPR